MRRNDDTGITYDLLGKMSVKEALLREYLGDSFPQQYQSILVFTNEKATIDDRCKKFPILLGSGVTYMIRQYGEEKVHRDLLTSNQIIDIRDIILAHHKVQRALSPVNCEQIIDDYAALMAAIEDAAAKNTEGSISEIAHNGNEHKTVAKSADVQKPKFTIDWETVGNVALGCATTTAPSYILYGLHCGKLRYRIKL